ncbi:hypothetical protein H6P81_014203 [Aristolochia fimbriata]|uniref:Uncharacterized protein n=1 Tax=Aristolochia fimbriata TaxID=158543 RepID=A0AAV7EIZ5_ARIFI|nr:hypothetical protein H6P81_014203 [Aristolochia fimbriata]
MVRLFVVYKGAAPTEDEDEESGDGVPATWMDWARESPKMFHKNGLSFVKPDRPVRPDTRKSRSGKWSTDVCEETDEALRKWTTSVEEPQERRDFGHVSSPRNVVNKEAPRSSPSLALYTGQLPSSSSLAYTRAYAVFVIGNHNSLRRHTQYNLLFAVHCELMARVVRIALLGLFALSLLSCSAVERIAVHATSEGQEEESKNESSASWTEWAKDKISGGLGMKEEPAKRPEDKSKDAAKKTEEAAEEFRESAGQVASDARQTLAEKARDASDKAKEATVELGKKAGEKGMEQAGWVKDKLKEAYEATKTEMEEESKEQMEWAKDRTKGGYDSAKGKTGETLDRAGQTGQENVDWAKDRARAGYDAAKSKAEETMDAAKAKAGDTVSNAKEKLSSTTQEKDAPTDQNLKPTTAEDEL